MDLFNVVVPPDFPSTKTSNGTTSWNNNQQIGDFVLIYDEFANYQQNNSDMNSNRYGSSSGSYSSSFSDINNNYDNNDYFDMTINGFNTSFTRYTNSNGNKNHNNYNYNNDRENSTNNDHGESTTTNSNYSGFGSSHTSRYYGTFNNSNVNTSNGISSNAHSRSSNRRLRNWSESCPLATSKQKMTDLESNGNWMWLHLPKNIRCSKNSLSFTSCAQTDYWYTPDTHNDNGHFFFTTMEDSFVATAQLSGNYSVVYDHMGFMMRVNDKLWFKTGIEYFNNYQHMSTVVTRGENEYSDWNVSLLNNVTPNRENDKENNLQLLTKYNPSRLYLRVTRLMIDNSNKILIEFSYDNKQWQFFRKFYFAPNVKKVDFGLMACSPKRTKVGMTKETQFNAQFNGVTIKKLSKDETKAYQDPVPDDAKEDVVTTEKA